VEEISIDMDTFLIHVLELFIEREEPTMKAEKCQGQSEMLADLFRALDTEDRGGLTFEEFSHGISILAPSLSRKGVSDLFAGHAESELLTFDAFKEVLLKAKVTETTDDSHQED
jgi:hypothetical protein